jgi:hypothetical protein
MKTLKYEEVYRQEYRDLGEARASLEQFIERVYNGKRLHSALGYRPPIEFEDLLPFLSSDDPPKSGDCMKNEGALRCVFEAYGIYRSDVSSNL